jgi:hypothetical protein
MAKVDVVGENVEQSPVAIADVLADWSSQDSVDTSFGPSVSRFELLRADAIEVAVPT